LHIEGNVSFNNGAAEGQGYKVNRDMLVGAPVSARDVVVSNNFTYQRDLDGKVRFGWGASGDKELAMEDNYFASGELYFATRWTDVTSSGNTVVDSTRGSVPNGGINVVRKPSGSDIFVRPNKYEAGRAHVIVYNWDENPTVSVDLSNVLTVGAHFELHHVYDLFGDPVVAGVYDGGAVEVPMRSTTAPRPIGDQQLDDPIVQGPEFGVFLVKTLQE
jgi:hypothetical protein